MSKAIAEIAIGAALIALDIVAPYVGIPLTTAVASAIVGAGASLVFSGIGTLLTKQQTGLGTTVRNPIAPWNVIYGRARVGGTTVYIESTGESDKYLHMIFVLACHPCQSVDALLMDNQRVIIDPSGNSNSPTQWNSNISQIVRVGDVVTVTLETPFVGLEDGDTITIQNVTGDLTLNGIFAVAVIDSSHFTYVCGGNPAIVDNSGQAVTNWPDYGDTIHMEVALGSQSPLSPPFPGLLSSADTGSKGLWTPQHLIQGKTAVYLRLKYGGNTYASGLPSIAFLVHGKNDILDPRPNTRGYTENAALCIADYLAHPVFGYKAVYGTEIPSTQLIAAANICDESVQIATGVNEPRYTCNGGFQLTTKRGEVLQNLLTSCAGRVTYTGGQFVIWPAAWNAPSIQIGPDRPQVASAVVTVWSSFINTTGAPAQAVITAAQFNGSGPSTIVSTTTPYARRADTLTLRSVDLLNLNADRDWMISATLSVSGGVVNGLAASIRIYDCSMDVVYADGTTGSLRPTLTNMSNEGESGFGAITNPADAHDQDTNPPASFATLTRVDWDNLNFANHFQLYGFPLGVPNAINTDGPTNALTLGNVTGAFQWKPKVSIRDLYNGVKGVYVCPANHWQSSDIPPYAQDSDHGYTNGPVEFFHDANLAADGGDRRWHEIQLPFTISTPASQRIAKIELLRRRYQGTGTFPFNLALYQATVLDIVSFTLPYLGWYNKLLECSKYRFTVNSENGVTVLGTELDLVETDPSVYEWSTSEELSAQGYQQTPTNTVRTIAAPTGVTAISDATTAAVGSDGVATSTIKVTWTLPTDGWITNGGSVLVQYQVVGASTWTGVGNFDPTTTTASITGVTDGTQYNVRVAFVNLAGVQSAWTQFGPITAGGSSLPPGLHFADDETPVGVMDGVNQIFTLAHVPNPAASLRLDYDGVKEERTVAYTLVGNTITFLRATNLPNDTDDFGNPSGEELIAWYRY